MIYGISVNMKANELFRLWNFSLSMRLKNMTSLNNTLLSNINNLSLDNQINLLLNENFPENAVIKKISIKNMQQIRKQTNDVKILGSIIDELAIRYKTTTQQLQDHIKGLTEENSKLKGDSRSKTTTNKEPPIDANMFANLANAFSKKRGWE